MNKPETTKTDIIGGKMNSDQRGSALVIALFVLALISVFVALAMSRTAAEAAAVGNETAEARTMYAAQGSLETMTRNFNKIFERKLNPTATDLASVETGVVPGLQPQFDFLQELDRTSENNVVNLTDRAYAGLVAIRDSWRLRTTATDEGGTEVRLTRNILNNRIPIFQFGIFYDDDLELFRPPRFSFGGRVHSNRHFFVSPGTEGVYFDSRVTAHGHIVTQTWRNGYTGDNTNNKTYIKNASGVDKQLLPSMGSVLNGTPNIFTDPDLPSSRLNPSFDSQSAIFDGNLQAETKELKLPLKVGNANADLVELIKRGKEVAGVGGGDLWRDDFGNVVPVTTPDKDNDIQRSERFANKTGIRVSLADSKSKLPGCASGVGTTEIVTRCGVRLDGHLDGLGTNPTAAPSPIPSPVPVNAADYSRGYQPKPMKLTPLDTVWGYAPTRANGERLHTGGGREVWIKVETVRTDDTTGAIITRDITEDFLSLGITEQALDLGPKFKISGYDSTAPGSSLIATTAQTASQGTDSRSILKLQRFLIPGPAIMGPGPIAYLTAFTSGGNYNTVVRYNGVDAAKIAAGCLAPVVCTGQNGDPNLGLERFQMKLASVNTTTLTYDKAVVPFPIKIFDTREGEHYDERSNTYYTDLNKLTRNGLMSMIDIDVANLRRFLRGDFNGLFPVNTPFAAGNGNVALTSADIPQKEGWVLYVSDRRGDEDFDGEFDMEDIYGANKGNDGVMQLGEDLQKPGAFGFGVLNTRYGTEAERYDVNTIDKDLAAVNDHKYYRRGIRLINGTTLPGIYDSATPTNTRGFTVASENGVYVKGNYNTTGLTVAPAGNINSPHLNYLPQNSDTHIPASIVADAVTILSNGWNDAQSFSSPYDEGGRIGTTTQMRFAMISGDTIPSKDATPNQGGISPRLNGGVHNFKRFLERWTGNRLDYSGSLINLFNSKNNNGSFKCCNTVYDPPIRNWVFDATFLDPNRIPPGTPFFQYVQTTGFERTTD